MTIKEYKQFCKLYELYKEAYNPNSSIAIPYKDVLNTDEDLEDSPLWALFRKPDKVVEIPPELANLHKRLMDIKFHEKWTVGKYELDESVGILTCGIGSLASLTFKNGTTRYFIPYEGNALHDRDELKAITMLKGWLDSEYECCGHLRMYKSFFDSSWDGDD